MSQERIGVRDKVCRFLTCECQRSCVVDACCKQSVSNGLCIQVSKACFVQVFVQHIFECLELMPQASAFVRIIVKAFPHCISHQPCLPSHQFGEFGRRSNLLRMSRTQFLYQRLETTYLCFVKNNLSVLHMCQFHTIQEDAVRI